MLLTEKELKKHKIWDIRTLNIWAYTKKEIVAPWDNFKLCWIPYELVDKQVY